MKKKLFLAVTLFVTVFPCLLKAQPDSLLRIYADDYQEERIYLHYDKSAYLPGETIWFKAYLMAGIEPSVNSKTLYIECADESGTVMEHITAPITLASAFGKFAIPGSYKGKAVQIRAYTKWMLNFDSSFLYNKNVMVVQPAANTPAIKQRVTLNFFPEGGDLINTITSRVAFKANNQFGYPANVKGAVFTAAGKFVDSIITRHDGLGSFMLRPVKGETYVAKWKDEFQVQHTSALPVAKEFGATIQAFEQNNNLMINVQRSEDAPDNFKQLRLVATIQKQLVYRSNIKLVTNAVQAKIPLEEFPTGVMQVTLFDENWVPIAERIYFVKNQEYELLADARIFKPNLTAKAKNYLEINVPDSFPANLSVAVTDADVNPASKDDIISSLLLTSDIKGYVHNPLFYFANSADSTNQYLDLVMLTHGWRRIRWQQVMARQLPSITYGKDSSYISLGGKIYGATASQIRSVEDINLIIKGKDSSSRFVQLPIKPDGSFSQPDYLFFDTVSVFYQFNKNKDMLSGVAINFSNGLLPTLKKIATDSLSGLNVPVDTTGLAKRREMYTRQAALEKLLQGTTLEGVTVKAKVKKHVDELDDKYASGLFKGSDAYQFDLTEDPSAAASMSVFAYLTGKVAGLLISDPNGSPSVTWRGSSTSLFLDEMQADVDMLKNIPMSDIAYIKVLRPPFFGATGGGAGGAIAVYTRRGADRKNTGGGKGLDSKALAGYTMIKDFYSPDYELHPEQKADSDTRTTLYWNPYIITNKKNRTVEVVFFNNDVSKKLRIDVQGMNAQGKLVSYQKVVQ